MRHSQVSVAVNADKAGVIVVTEEKARRAAGAAQEGFQEARAAEPQPSLPAANTPTLPAPQMQPDVSTQSEAVVVADTEPSVIATAEDDPPIRCFSKDGGRSRNLLVGLFALTQEVVVLGTRTAVRAALLRLCQFADINNAQRLLRFWPRAVLLRLRTSNGLGHGAPLICSEDPPAIYPKVLFEIFKPHRCELFALVWLGHRPRPFVTGLALRGSVRRRSSENPHPVTC